MRRPWALLLLWALLSGCGAPPPAEVPENPETAAILVEPEAPEEGGPLDRVTHLPQSLIDELRRRVAAGEDGWEDLLPLRADRDLTEEEAAALAPEAVDCEIADHALWNDYAAVDFDNDGIEDLFVRRRMGQGTMGMSQVEYWRGLPGGGCDCGFYEDAAMSRSLFIAWEGRTYEIVRQSDLLSKDDVPQLSPIGLSAACFAEGRPQERAFLTFDPAALWTQGVYDAAGTQTGWVDVLPEEADITLEVYTRGVNTGFPPPSH